MPFPLQSDNLNLLIVTAETGQDVSYRQFLNQEGFDVSLASEGEILKGGFPGRDTSTVILEWNKPGTGECEVIRKFRAKGLDLPLVVVYHGGSSELCSESLDVGADDYLKNPFEIKELVSRLRAVNRRYRPETSRVLRIADIEVNEVSRKVVRAGNPIHLSQTEFKLLAFLVRNKGRIVPKKEIIENVWGINFETGTNVVDVYISYLRRAVDSGYPKKLIHTIHGEGIIVIEEGL